MTGRNNGRAPRGTPFFYGRGDPWQEETMSAESFGKDEWVALFREIGLDDVAMHRWHAAFEQRAPEAHQSFLEWLRVSAADIGRIRDASRADWS
jgi:hypothetical protein